MKKITFFLLLLTVSLGYSQVVVIEDFDSTAPTVTWDQDNGNASATVSTTQAVSGANSLELITTDAGAPWQGAKLLMQNNKIDMTDATTGVGTNKTVTFQLYSDTPRRFLLKLSDGDVGGVDPAQESKTAVAHTGSGWELMTADFTVGADLGQPGYNPPNDQFSSIIFFPLFATNGLDEWDVCCDPNIALATTTYIDDVSSYAGDVIGAATFEILEDYDGTAPTVIWDQDNGNASATVSTIQAVSGANSLELITTDAGAPWQGAKLLMQNNKIDLTDATTGVGANKTVTFQLYSDAPRRFLLKLSDGDVGGVDPAQESKTAVAHTGSGWELMTADFTVGADLGQPGYNPPNDQFSSIIFFPLFATNGLDEWDVCCDPNIALATTTYIDDVSSWAGDAIVPASPDPEAAPVPTAPDGETYSIYNDTNSYSTVFPVLYSFGTLGGEPDLDPGAGVNNALKFDFTFAGWGQGEGGPDDVSAYGFVNFMYWAEAGVPGFQFRMISNNGGITEHIYEIGTQEAVVTEQWTQVSIPMSYFTNLGFSSTNFFQWKCDPFMQVVTDPGAVYIDNIILTLNALSVDEFDNIKFDVYPNPTRNVWNVNTNNQNISSIYVFDVQGRQVLNMALDASKATIDASSLPSGLYFAKINSGNESKTVKLIKE